MTLLLIGLVVVAAAWRLMPRATTRRGALWVAPLTLLVILQLAQSGDLLAGYQIRVLGQRFALGSDLNERVVSGDREGSDVYVDGAGAAPVARIVRTGDTLRLLAAEGSGSLVLVRTGGAGSDWTVLRSVPLEDGGRIWLTGSEGSRAWTFQRTRSALGLRGSGDLLAGESGGTVQVPYPDAAGFLGFFPGRPSVFQRTYPLADLLGSFDAPGTAALSSFLYYKDGDPHVAVLDGSVAVERSGESVEPLVSVNLGTGDGPKARIMVAGLPHRDFPDPRLSPEERYGVRPLRSFDPRTDGDWMTLAEPRPRVVSLPVADQDDIGLALDGQEFVPVWIRPGAGDVALDGVALPEYSQRFGAASQGLLRLPVETDAGIFRLLTPSGLAEWTTGRPFTLGDDDRGILIRVDGLAASSPFLLTLLGLFALGALPLLAPLPGRIKALALVAMGFACVRALLSVSALARYPFVDEGHHISLWLIPALPWLVCALGRVASDIGGVGPGPASAVVPRGFSGGYMGTPGGQGFFRLPWRGRMDPRSPVVTVGVPAVALMLLALVLFPTSPARAATLSLLTACVAAWTWGGPGRAPWSAVARLRQRARTVRVPGALLGTVLLVGRGALEVAGFREQVSLGGVRIGLSVLYTPLAALVFAFVLWVHLERVDRASRGRVPLEIPWAWLDLGLFLATAFVGVSLWISDFGIALTALPGPLLILLAVGFHWGRRFGPGAAIGGLLPLSLFLVLQVEPRVMQPGLAEGPISTRLEDWSRNELLLLERGDPELLRLIGESRSEALAVMRETMRSYTRGSWLGRGFLEGRVSTEIRSTAVREHAVGGLVASQWGLLGTLGLVGMLLAAVLPFVRDLPRGPGEARSSLRVWLLGAGLCVGAVALLPTPADLAVLVAATLGAAGAALLPLVGDRPGRIESRLWWPARPTPEAPGSGADVMWLVGAVAVVTFSFAGLYMVLANYGLVLFTGKNVYLLGLDSLGDTLEAMALLGIGAVGLARSGAARIGEQRQDEDVRVDGVDVGARVALVDRRRVG